jgi:hypothetical protein
MADVEDDGITVNVDDLDVVNVDVEDAPKLAQEPEHIKQEIKKAEKKAKKERVSPEPQGPSPEEVLAQAQAFAKQQEDARKAALHRAAAGFDNIYQVLVDRHPLIGGFEVPPSFEKCGPDGMLPDPTGEPSLGGHAFSIFMASRKDQWFADDNSWGIGWGKQGVGFMPDGYRGRYMELWAICPVP